MIKRSLKFGLVGAGAIAQSYAQAFNNFEGYKLVAVADTRQDAALAFAEVANCASYESYKEMSAAEELDAVLICTPPVTHPEIAIHFLEHRIPVLCEKPLSIDLNGAKSIIDASERTGTLLTMASKFRYVDDVRRAKSILTSGILGDIVLFENAFTARVDMSRRWNSNASVSGGGVLIDNGTHSLDIARYFLGPLAEVQVVEGKRPRNLPVEETVHVSVRSESGIMGAIDLSWSIDKETDTYINIYGTHGTVCVGWKESRYRQVGSSDWIVFGKGYSKLQALRAQLQNFARAVEQREPLLITSQDALASVAAIEVSYAALRMNQWVHVPAVETWDLDSSEMLTAAVV